MASERRAPQVSTYWYMYVLYGRGLNPLGVWDINYILVHVCALW